MGPRGHSASVAGKDTEQALLASPSSDGSFGSLGSLDGTPDGKLVDLELW